MNAIIKALGKFLGRDFMYVIGGASFLLSAFFAVGYKFSNDFELMNKPIVSILALGFAYVAGYINQEVVCLTPLLTTSIVHPCRLLRWFYKKFTRSEFKDLPDIEYTSERIRLSKCFEEERLEDLERIITLKHIGSAVGSNWLLASAILFIRYFAKRDQYLILVIAIYFLVAALSLILIAWIKGMQQYSIMNNLLKQIE